MSRSVPEKELMKSDLSGRFSSDRAASCSAAIQPSVRYCSEATSASESARPRSPLRKARVSAREKRRPASSIRTIWPRTRMLATLSGTSPRVASTRWKPGGA